MKRSIGGISESGTPGSAKKAQRKSFQKLNASNGSLKEATPVGAKTPNKQLNKRKSGQSIGQTPRPPFKGNNATPKGNKLNESVKSPKEKVQKGNLVRVANAQKTKKRKSQPDESEEESDLEEEPVKKKSKKNAKGKVEPEESLDEDAESEAESEDAESEVESEGAESDSEDEEENQVKEKAKKPKKEKVKKNKEEEEKRTVFVGNVPLTAKKEPLTAFFAPYGKVLSVRFRAAPLIEAHHNKKQAAIKKEFNANAKSWIAFVKYDTKEAAQNALNANGKIFEEHHLRVKIANEKDKPDGGKAVFIGNLPRTADEDQLWTLFESCGDIESVRIVRHSYTGENKGFAFVNFADSDAVQLALEMEDVTLEGRELRIKEYSESAPKRERPVVQKKKRPFKKFGKKPGGNKPGNKPTDNAKGGPKEKSPKGPKSPKDGKVKKNAAFQGAKSVEKKKKPTSKDALTKKRLAKVLGSKTSK